MNTTNYTDTNKDELFDLSDLFEFLKYILGCTYISDLNKEPYVNDVKIILGKLDLTKYPSRQVDDVFEYIYGKKQ